MAASLLQDMPPAVLGFETGFFDELEVEWLYNNVNG